jgi:hypothetical protein
VARGHPSLKRWCIHSLLQSVFKTMPLNDSKIVHNLCMGGAAGAKDKVPPSLCGGAITVLTLVHELHRSSSQAGNALLGLARRARNSSSSTRT